MASSHVPAAARPRTLDHLVLCVNALAAARATYHTLGFTLTPPAEHPFGTRNSLVQMPGQNFLELLAIGDTAVIPAHEPDGQFSFALRSQHFLRDHGEGLSMLVCASDDARADIGEFRAAGLVTYDPFDFERDATLPDGRIVHVAFSLAFATHPELPDLALFTCQQRHAPENFWRPAFQAHANGAQRIVEVIMEADTPVPVATVLGQFTGGASVVAADGGTVHVGPDTDRITVMTPAMLRRRFPELRDVPPGTTPRFVAFRITVADRDALRAVLDAAGVAYRAADTTLVIPPAAAHGMIIEFG